MRPQGHLSKDPHPDPQTLAEAVARTMFARDTAAQGLGMRIEAVGPGRASLAMTVREDMLNGFQMCQGGLIAALADAAFAYACNSRNVMTVAAGIVIDFVAPAHAGDRLVADAREVSRGGSTGVYDVAVADQLGRTVALMRGRSHSFKGRHVVAVDGAET